MPSHKAIDVLVFPAQPFVAPRTSCKEVITGHKVNFSYNYVLAHVYLENKVSTFSRFFYVLKKIIINGDRPILELTHIKQLIWAPIFWLARFHIIYDCFERFEIDYSYRFSNPIIKSLVRFSVAIYESTIILFFIKGCFVVSSREEFLFKRFRKFNKNTVVLPNVPLINSNMDYDILAKFDSSILRVVYIGGVSAEKGINKLVELAKLIKDSQLPVEILIYGQFDSDHDKSLLEGLVDKFSLNKYLKYSGVVEYGDLNFVLQKAHFGLNFYPIGGRMEYVGPTSSRKNFEYMAAGVIPITTSAGDIALPVLESNAGFSLKYNSEVEVFDILLKCAHNRDYTKTIARNALSVIKEIYNVNKSSIDILKVYQEAGMA